MVNLIKIKNFCFLKAQVAIPDFNPGGRKKIAKLNNQINFSLNKTYK